LTAWDRGLQKTSSGSLLSEEGESDLVSNQRRGNPRADEQASTHSGIEGERPKYSCLTIKNLATEEPPGGKERISGVICKTYKARLPDYDVRGSLLAKTKRKKLKRLAKQGGPKSLSMTSVAIRLGCKKGTNDPIKQKTGTGRRRLKKKGIRGGRHCQQRSKIIPKEQVERKALRTFSEGVNHSAS